MGGGGGLLLNLGGGSTGGDGGASPMNATREKERGTERVIFLCAGARGIFLCAGARDKKHGLKQIATPEKQNDNCRQLSC